MHTAHAFSIAAAFAADELAGKTPAAALAVVTLFTTCMTKAHGPPHLALGLLLAAAGHYAVFRPLGRRLGALRPERCGGSWLRFYGATVAPVAFIAAG